MKHISVIGSGTMGNGIAHTFAQFGHSVSMVDISEEALQRGLNTISKNLDRQVVKGLISEQEKKEIYNRINVYTEFKSGVENADLVVEAATENIDLKLKIFQDLNKYCKPETILTLQ